MTSNHDFTASFAFPPCAQEADKKAKEKAKRERAAAKKEKVRLGNNIMPTLRCRAASGTAALPWKLRNVGCEIAGVR